MIKVKCNLFIVYAVIFSSCLGEQLAQNMNRESLDYTLISESEFPDKDNKVAAFLKKYWPSNVNKFHEQYPLFSNLKLCCNLENVEMNSSKFGELDTDSKETPSCENCKNKINLCWYTIDIGLKNCTICGFCFCTKDSILVSNINLSRDKSENSIAFCSKFQVRGVPILYLFLELLSDLKRSEESLLMKVDIKCIKDNIAQEELILKTLIRFAKFLALITICDKIKYSSKEEFVDIVQKIKSLSPRCFEKSFLLELINLVQNKSNEIIKRWIRDSDPSFRVAYDQLNRIIQTYKPEDLISAITTGESQVPIQKLFGNNAKILNMIQSNKQILNILFNNFSNTQNHTVSAVNNSLYYALLLCLKNFGGDFSTAIFGEILDEIVLFKPNSSYLLPQMKCNKDDKWPYYEIAKLVCDFYNSNIEKMFKRENTSKFLSEKVGELFDEKYKTIYEEGAIFKEEKKETGFMGALLSKLGFRN